MTSSDLEDLLIDQARRHVTLSTGG